jgi:hypothetical protein
VAPKPESKTEESSKQERDGVKRLDGLWKAANKFGRISGVYKFRRIGGVSDVPAVPPRTPFKS